MRKLARTLFLAGVLMALLCVTAWAEETPTEAGIYGAQQVGSNPVTISSVETDKLTVMVSDSVANAQYLVLALNEAATVPTEKNIVYIDQNSTGAFTVYPSQLVSGTTYHIYITSDSDNRYNSEMTEVASFQYYAPYTLGDVNEDGTVNIKDAQAILDNMAQRITLVGNQILAANVNSDATVDIKDAQCIVDFIVGRAQLG